MMNITEFGISCINYVISGQDRPAQAIYQPRSRPRANAEEPAARNSGGSMGGKYSMVNLIILLIIMII
jgi:hypothetical protein